MVHVIWVSKCGVGGYKFARCGVHHQERGANRVFSPSGFFHYPSFWATFCGASYDNNIVGEAQICKVCCLDVINPLHHFHCLCPATINSHWSPPQATRGSSLSPAMPPLRSSPLHKADPGPPPLPPPNRPESPEGTPPPVPPYRGSPSPPPTPSSLPTHGTLSPDSQHPLLKTIHSPISPGLPQFTTTNPLPPQSGTLYALTSHSEKAPHFLSQ